MAISVILDYLRQNPTFFICVASILGLMVGSFLNVVIYRLPIMMEKSWLEGAEQFLREHAAQKQPSDHSDSKSAHSAKADEPPTDAGNTPAAPPFNLVVPRSRCPHCNTLIHAWQNIPIFSYLMLRGRCGQCRASISIRYPLIEACTGILTGLLAYHFGVTWAFLAACLFTWTLLSASLIDYDHYLLPDQMTLSLMWLGLLLATQNLFVSLTEAVLGAALGYFSLWCVFWIFKICTKKDGMGFGDFKLLAALGAWCGWQSLPSIIVLSSLVGAVLGVSLILFCGRDRAKPIPFGPYLASAGWLYFTLGDTIDVRQWLF